MEAIRDRFGNLRPDMDFRWVPVSVMCEYLGVSKPTVYKQMNRGFFPREGIKTIGRGYWFSPRRCCPSAEIDHPVGSDALEPFDTPSPASAPAPGSALERVAS